MRAVALVAALGLIALGVSAVFVKRELQYQRSYEQLDNNYKYLAKSANDDNSASVQPTVQPVQPAQPQIKPVDPPISYTEPSLPQIEWHTWKDAPRIAQQTGKPAYIHFTKQTGCPACEQLRQYVYPDARVVEASRNFVCVEIYLALRPEDETAEGNAALAAFGIDRKQGFPQDVFLWPGWSRKNLGVHKVLGEKIPKQPQEFTQYLNEWSRFLNSNQR